MSDTDERIAKIRALLAELDKLREVLSKDLKSGARSSVSENQLEKARRIVSFFPRRFPLVAS